MKDKSIHHGVKARSKVIAGIKKVYRAVGSTLGPYGTTVVIENEVRKDNPPTVTKDGVSVARVIHLPNQLEQLGARLVLQASTQADTKSGDGTTTTVVLAYHLIKVAQREVEAGVSLREVRNALDSMVEDVIGHIETVAQLTPVTPEVIGHVARISANGEERLAKVAISASEQANGGPVIVKTHRAEEDEIECLMGAIMPGAPLTSDQLDRSAELINLEKPLVCLYNGRLTIDALEMIARAAENKTGNLVIVTKDMHDAVGPIVAKINQTNRMFKIIVLAAPGAGTNRQRYLGIMSKMLGTNVVEPGHVSVTLGIARAVQVDTKYSALIPDLSFDTRAEADLLIAERDGFAIGSIGYRRADELLRFVLGRRVTVYVGGMTEADIKERYDRMVDAIHAIDSVQDGVIPGGGTVLAMAEHYAEVGPYGKALRAPMAKLLQNGGIVDADHAVVMAVEATRNDTDLPYSLFREPGNALYVDLLTIDEPVYDPARVTINALKAAAQVAATVVCTDCYIVEH